MTLLSPRLISLPRPLKINPYFKRKTCCLIHFSLVYTTETAQRQLFSELQMDGNSINDSWHLRCCQSYSVRAPPLGRNNMFLCAFFGKSPDATARFRFFAAYMTQSPVMIYKFWWLGSRSRKNKEGHWSFLSYLFCHMVPLEPKKILSADESKVNIRKSLVMLGKKIINKICKSLEHATY